MAKKQMARAKQLKSGNWNVQILAGFDENGKRIRKSFTAPIRWKSINEAKNLIVTALKMYSVRLDLNVTLPAKKPKIKELPTAEQVIKMVRGTDIELPCMLAM